MDKLIGIFQQLGVDGSIFIQFGIFTVLFLLLKTLLFNKLLFVLQLRESKTTKLDSEANEVFQKADSLSREYNEQVAVIHNRANDQISKRKEEIKKSEEAKLKNNTESLLSDYENKKIEIITKAENQSKELQNISSGLTEDLLSKFVN